MTSPINCAWAVNVAVEEGTLRIGALYVEPNIPTSIIRLESKGDIFDVVLPDELVQRDIPFRAWNVQLPLNDYDQ